MAVAKKRNSTVDKNSNRIINILIRKVKLLEARLSFIEEENEKLKIDIEKLK